MCDNDLFAFSQVGPTYGRKTLCGLLAADGERIGLDRVGKALRKVNPCYQQARATIAYYRLNPTPYHADYFGQKLHVDQNEKLVMFGVTHVCAIDGFSGKIVGFITMPIKNNVEIYNHLFRSVISEEKLLCNNYSALLTYKAHSPGIWHVGSDTGRPR